MGISNDNFAKNEKELITEYHERGYTENFRFENGKLKTTNADKAYGHEVIYIAGEHRYEGMSNPSDMSILYALETVEGEKGAFLMGYGASADLETAHFF